MKSLTSVTVPSNCEIQPDVFRDCENLKSIMVEEPSDGHQWLFSLDGILYICTAWDDQWNPLLEMECCPGGKTDAVIPSNVISIDGFAFSCTNLTSINVDESNEFYSSEEGILYNKDKTDLIRCPGGLTEVNILEGIYDISTGAFEGCKKITSVTIPEGLAIICRFAFSGCSNLSTVSFSSTVCELGGWAFDGCPLNNITCRALTPPRVATSPEPAFYMLNYDDCILYVPEESVEKYQTAKGWEKFINIQPISETKIDTVEDNDVAVSVLGIVWDVYP